jgi:hypothetical protein
MCSLLLLYIKITDLMVNFSHDEGNDRPEDRLKDRLEELKEYIVDRMVSQEDEKDNDRRLEGAVSFVS